MWLDNPLYWKQMAYHCCWNSLCLVASLMPYSVPDQPIQFHEATYHMTICCKGDTTNLSDIYAPCWFGVVWSLAAAVCANNANINGNVPPRQHKKLPVRHHLKHATGPEQGCQLECFHRPFGKKTVEKKLTLQSISLLEPKRSKLWDFVFDGEASRAWLPIMMRMY